MERIPASQIISRIQSENPWWVGTPEVPPQFKDLPQRAYFLPLLRQIKSHEPRRALVLLGPRRVGKTVLMHQAIGTLLSSKGILPKQVRYVSVDHPLYDGLALDHLIELIAQAAGEETGEAVSYVFLDEIQYSRDWERHLKILVDERPELKLIASGSAAAALRLKSQESGAGRFTEFLLPPLTFHEYLLFRDRDSLIQGNEALSLPSGWIDLSTWKANDLTEVNAEFIKYLNYGGYPEVLFSQAVQADMPRYVKSDVIDKVLLRDLPGLYGISDIQELNSLFTTLAYNTGNEVSLEGLSQNSGVSKNTIKRYMEYLEAAFLIKTVHRVDQRGRRFQRANYFKVYLTNASMRAALFSPLEDTDPAMGRLVETCVFGQWFHRRLPLFYARWGKSEIDIVSAYANKLEWAVEVKWSDRAAGNPSELDEATKFCRQNSISKLVVTTRTIQQSSVHGDFEIIFIPASLYAYAVGRTATMIRQFADSVPPHLLDSPSWEALQS